MRLDPWKLLTELPTSQTPTRAALTLAIAAATGQSRVVVANRLTKALNGTAASRDTADLCAAAMGVPVARLLSDGDELADNRARLRVWIAAGMPVRPV